MARKRSSETHNPITWILHRKLNAINNNCGVGWGGVLLKYMRGGVGVRNKCKQLANWGTVSGLFTAATRWRSRE